MPRTSAALAALVLLAAGPATAMDIQHEGVGCVVADQFPRLEVRLSPADSVARARVHFKPANGKHWYSVALKPEGDSFGAVLPKPRKQLASLTYYIEVTDTALVASRTAEFSPMVAAGPVACQDKKVASSVASATVALEVPAGAPAVPAGFSGSGLAAAGVAAGAAAGAAVGAAAAGGGAATAVLVAGGVVAAAGAAAAVVVTGGGGEGDGGPGGQPPSPIRQFEISFDPRLEVTACASEFTSFNGVVFEVADSGDFNALVSQLTPIVRVVGRVDNSSFQGTFTCVARSSASMTLSAAGSGGNFAGSFSFDGRGGTWRGNFKARP